MIFWNQVEIGLVNYTMGYYTASKNEEFYEIMYAFMS